MRKEKEMIVKGIDIYALVAAIDSYDAGPGQVMGKEKLLKELGVKESWKEIDKIAGEEGYYDT